MKKNVLYIQSFLLCLAWEVGCQTSITINEFLASNQSMVADQDGEFDDWIELFNLTDQDVDLSGYYLSDNPDNLPKYAFPAGTFIKAKDYLIIWADEDGKQKGLHANFKLSAGGESLFLLRPDTSLIERVDFGEQKTDLSYARIPNGSGPFQITTPTFNKSNTGTSAAQALSLAAAGILSYPNPASEKIILKTHHPELISGYLGDLTGRPLKRIFLNGQQELDLTGLPGGYYIIQLGQATSLILVNP